MPVGTIEAKPDGTTKKSSDNPLEMSPGSVIVNRCSIT